MKDENKIERPIICDVRIADLSFKNNYGRFYTIANGEFVCSREDGRFLERIVVLIAHCAKLSFPDRFSWNCCELVYEDQDLAEIRISGSYVSSVDIETSSAVRTPWSTKIKPKTSLNQSGNIVIPPRMKKGCYFVSYKMDNVFTLAWKLEGNRAVKENPEKYPGRFPQTIDLTNEPNH